MILEDFILPSRANQHWKYSGIDSLELCLDKKYFKEYPYHVSYDYNSRGFRDVEWPDTIQELQKAIWCVGDSFTVGLGSPVEHTWPYRLNQSLGYRTINVSMDGASNDWIFRKAIDIVNKIKPKVLIVHWSYVERAESSIAKAFNRRWKNFYNDIRDSRWPDPPDIINFKSLPTTIQNECIELHDSSWLSPVTDENRMLMDSTNTIEEDIQRTLNHIHDLNQFIQTQTIHTFIPKFLPASQIAHFNSLMPAGPVIQTFDQLDMARDSHHYDIQTSNHLVGEILKIIEL